MSVKYEDVADRVKISQQEFEKLTSEEVAKLIEEYDDGLKSILYDFNRYLKIDSFYAKKHQNVFFGNIGSSLAKLQNKLSNRLAAAIKKSVFHGNNEAIDDLRIAGVSTSGKDFHKEIRADVADAAIEDAKEYIGAQTQRMAGQMKRHIKSIVTDVLRRAATEGLSYREAGKEVKAQVMEKDPTFQFIDKAGRRWDSGKYFEVLAISVMQNARREAYIESCAREGHDLVLISAHGAPDRCSRWENKTISLTGKTIGYPTYAQSKASGDIWHPRCRHRLIAVSQ